MITYASQYNIWYLKIDIILLNVVTFFVAFWNRLYLQRGKMASTFDNVQVAVLTETYNFKFLTDHPVVLDVSHQGDCVMMQFFKGICNSFFLIIFLKWLSSYWRTKTYRHIWTWWMNDRNDWNEFYWYPFYYLLSYVFC